MNDCDRRGTLTCVARVDEHEQLAAQRILTHAMHGQCRQDFERLAHVHRLAV